MIVTRTPVRVSFLGGGTDYPDYFLQHGGQTLGVAIDRYSYVTVNPLAGLFDYTIRVSYSRMELTTSVGEIQHPAVRECLRFMKIDGGLEIHYVGDLPARTGLGSSSSFTVALLHALHAFRGDLASREQLAEEACHVEHQMIRERVGVQDQYTCAMGGLVHLRMAKGGRIGVEHVPLAAERLAALGAHLMLLYTGIRRDANEVLEEQLDRTRSGAITQDLSRMSGLVDDGLATLTGDGPLAAFGELLDAAWTIKRELSSKITSDAIDRSYARARAAGAIGGKLLGAGGGGFLLLFVPDRQDAVTAALPELPRIRFGFDHEGSRILFYRPQ